MADPGAAEEMLRRAAHNNAVWCDAVCAPISAPASSIRPTGSIATAFRPSILIS